MKNGKLKRETKNENARWKMKKMQNKNKQGYEKWQWKVIVAMKKENEK